MASLRIRSHYLCLFGLYMCQDVHGLDHNKVDTVSLRETITATDFLSTFLQNGTFQEQRVDTRVY